MLQNEKLEKYLILKKEMLAKSCVRLTIRCPEIAKKASAGQFAHVRANGFMLRRPISISEIDKEAGTIRLVFEVRGEGTAVIAELNAGDTVDMLAPLGNGFTLEKGKKVVLLGGGIGTPPMLEVAKFYGADATVITGFRSASAVILQDDFKKTGANVMLCTDDGTAGEHGLVTAPLARVLEGGNVDLVCACGPNGMLKGVVSLAKEHGVSCEVSLEERMGCGVGACLVCACKSVKNGEEYYARVCKDGPVFNAEEVTL